ncbi:unnamed protein product [Miscanthus lutarioriparius]|uniref:Dirigent protein n=1 Tax=Miscanthus lutarioriparius TaxID=422564 RepID=A0A811NUV0_9POAL|nr:unnamed protein product [Miscanthus lutarioriparius]
MAATTSAARSLLLCLLLAFLHGLQFQIPPVAAATSHNKTESRDGRGKTLSFTLYQHETINKTGYIVVDGVAGAGVSQTTTPFGTIYVFRDDLTVRADRASPVAGVAEGSSITTSLDGLQSLSLAKITVHHRGHRGSVSVLGGTYNNKAVRLPGAPASPILSCIGCDNNGRQDRDLHRVPARQAERDRGTATTTSFDGLHNLLAAKISLHHRGYRGSVSVLGGSHNTKPSVYPVVGGTGDFLYTEGYVQSSPVDSDGPRVMHKLEIHLYWPPYTKFAPVP